MDVRSLSSPSRFNFMKFKRKNLLKILSSSIALKKVNPSTWALNRVSWTSIIWQIYKERSGIHFSSLSPCLPPNVHINESNEENGKDKEEGNMEERISRPPDRVCQ